MSKPQGTEQGNASTVLKQVMEQWLIAMAERVEMKTRGNDADDRRSQ